jgi:hypothetical protein
MIFSTEFGELDLKKVENKTVMIIAYILKYSG